MKMWKVILLCLGLVVPPPLHAQSLTSRSPRAEDVASLDGIIAAFYDVVSHAAGEPVDWGRDSTLYLSDLRFKIVSASDSMNQVSIIDHQTYATNGADVSVGFFEREIHRVTNRFGPMAQVFSTYEWSTQPNGRVGGRGINAIELYFDGKRWWISSAMWTAETARNPIPTHYLPQPGSPR
jgi:hypothetical protein